MQLAKWTETRSGPGPYDRFADGDGLLANWGDVAGECEGTDASAIS